MNLYISQCENTVSVIATAKLYPLLANNFATVKKLLKYEAWFVGFIHFKRTVMHSLFSDYF